MDDASAIPLAIPVALVLAGLALGLVLQRSIIARLRRAAAGTGTGTDDIVFAIFHGPVVLWGTVLGLYLATQVAGIPAPVGRVIQRVLLILLITSLTWTAARFLGELVRPGAESASGDSGSPQLLANLARGLVFLVGGLVILQNLGIAITPLITALGIGGLAVGLALQDTLANLFAGIHLLVSGQVNRGDFIRLQDGQEGLVQDITWRYTTIRQLANVTIVPNAKLSSAITANYTLPDRTHTVLVTAAVTHDVDLARVEAIALEVAQAVMDQVMGATAGFTPQVRFHAWDDARIRFSVVLSGRDVVAQYRIRHEFIKRLHQRFREEQIG